MSAPPPIKPKSKESKEGKKKTPQAPKKKKNVTAEQDEEDSTVSLCNTKLSMLASLCARTTANVIAKIDPDDGAVKLVFVGDLTPSGVAKFQRMQEFADETPNYFSFPTVPFNRQLVGIEDALLSAPTSQQPQAPFASSRPTLLDITASTSSPKSASAASNSRSGSSKKATTTALPLNSFGTSSNEEESFQFTKSAQQHV